MSKSTKGSKGSKQSKSDRSNDLAPPSAGHQKPALWELGGIPFQEFCRDILAEDDTIRTCDQYGPNGKSDHGIDLLATLKSEDAIIVAQCKAKKSFPKSAVKAVSKDFFEHWNSQWHDKNIKRFILMVACELQDTDVVTELNLQKARFAQHNIEYEWWSNSTIVTRLRPHRTIVNRYLRYWLEHICGPQVSQQFSTSTGSTLVSAALTAQVEQLMVALTKETGRLLDQATQLWKEGKGGEADLELSALQKDSTRWSALEPSVRADILTLRGKLALEFFDTKSAEHFANEGSALGQFPSVSCLFSLIALTKDDVAESLNHIKECNTEAADRIRISIMLQEGKSDDALRLISKIESTSALAPDMLRLKALALLLQKNVKEALAAIDDSLSLQPAWKYSKLVSGIIRYYAALSPSEIRSVMPAWPVPLDWSSVKHNDEARQRLQEAASIFDSLRKTAAHKAEREQVEGWLIGALSNDRSAQQRAEEECKHLLEGDPLHGPAIAWATARKYPVISPSTRTALTSAGKDGSLEPDQILSLVLIHIGDGNTEAAGEVLDAARQIFDNARIESLWLFWRAQIYLLSEDIESAASLFGGMDHIPMDLLPLVRQKAKQELFLANRQIDDLHGRALLDVCISKARAGKYDYVIANAERLISEVQTEQSIRVIAQALVKVAQYQGCIDLLSANAALFNGQTLPHDLQLVQAQCYQCLGLVNKAVEQAERAVLLTANTQTMLAYVTILLQTGNMQAMVAIVRRLSRQPDLTPVQAIRLGEVIQRDDPVTAKVLWHRSTSGRLKGDYIFRAITLGYRLGLERDPAYINFCRQIQHIAQSGSKQIRPITLDQAAEEFRKQRQASEKRAKAYRDAIAAVHFIYDVPLLYHSSPSSVDGAIVPLNRYQVFAHHEDRLAFGGFPDEKPAWKLNLDITAVMVAQEFDFLDALLEVTEYINIPSETIPALVTTRQRLQMLPNDRVVALEHILKSISAKQIITFNDEDLQPPIDESLTAEQRAQIGTERLVEHIKQEGGWFVDFISFNGASSKASQAADFPQRIDAASVVSSLKTNSLISDEQSEAALSRLRKTDSETCMLLPPLRSKLFTQATMLETLSEAGVLDQVLSNFEVYLPNSDRAVLQRSLDGHLAASETYGWLSTLIDRLNSYIQLDKIRVLQHFNREITPDSNGSEQSLYSLLQFSPQQHDVLWIDDRFVNKYMHRDNGVPIVTSWEVLKALAIGPFGKQKYYETLVRMRAANIRYIPLDADEIFFHLQQAPIENHELVETSELQTLRRYVAACITQSEMAHKHQANSDPIIFFERLRQGITEAWDRVWKADAPYNRKTLWASWLRIRLFAEPRSLCMTGAGAVTNSTLASTISELLFTALVMFERGAEAASQYLEWLFKTSLEPILQTHPGLAKAVAAAVMQCITAHIGDDSKSSNVLPLLRWWYYNMPKTIRNELTDDVYSMSMLQLRNVSLGEMYGLTFFWDDLEKAITSALSSGDPQSINTRQAGQVEISAQTLANNRVAVTLTSSERSLSFADDETQYFFNTPHERRLALIRQRQWIDVAPDQFEAIVSKLAYSEPASIRIGQLQHWQEANANAYYAILHEAIRTRQRVHHDRFLPPSMESLLNHNRFRNPNCFDVHETLKQLFQEEISTFAEVVSGLPCMITDELLTAIDNSLPATKRKLVKALLATGTPLSLIQLVRILGTPSNNRAYALLRRKILNRLLTEEALSEYEAFVSLLRWVSNRFAGLPDARDLHWNVRLGLAWLHASKIFGILRSLGLTADWIVEKFDRSHKLTSVAILDSTSPIRDDAATANLVSAESLLASGLFYSMSTDELVQAEHRLIDMTLIQLDGGETFPKPNLFRSPAKSNTFNSFLGLDIGEMASFSSALRTLSVKNLSLLASDGIKRIRDKNQPYFWWLVLGYVIPRTSNSNEFSDEIKSLLDERGLLALVKEAKNAFAPIIVATAHAAIDGTLAKRLIEDIKYIAIHADRFVDDVEGRTRTESELMLYQAFMEAGFALSRQDGKFAADAFGDLMIDISQRCPGFASGLSHFMDDLWEELPAEESAALWRLRTHLEALQ